MDARAGAGAGPGGRPDDRAGPASRPGRPAGGDSRPAGPGVAAFDFDGTLTRRDSLLPFLLFVRGAAATAQAVVAESPRFGRVLLGRATRDEAKEALLTRLLSGADLRQLSDAGQVFGERLATRGVRPAMRRRLEWHRQAGHRVVIVSASPTLYLNAAGRRLGVDAVMATELEVDADGRLTGKLAGRNCRGDEKAKRLRAWLDDSGHEPSGQVWAYGDSRGDAEMLALADVGVWVGWRRLLSGRIDHSRSDKT
jgi:phosphatidylglycerophosphatase C